MASSGIGAHIRQTAFHLTRKRYRRCHFTTLQKCFILCRNDGSTFEVEPLRQDPEKDRTQAPVFSHFCIEASNRPAYDLTAFASDTGTTCGNAS
jgi:hypothetical protein